MSTAITTLPSSILLNSPSGESFTTFFERWLQQQDRDLQSLLAAASPHRPQEDGHIRLLVDRVVSNYETYYRNKAASAEIDVKPMFSPTWTSSTENLFLWVGGWRPSMAIHLLYSKCGIELESRLSNLANGNDAHDHLACLSASQLELVDALQRETVQKEREISEEEAELQETVADAQMVKLTGMITEMGGSGGEGVGREMLGLLIGTREEGMARVLEKADRSRLETLKEVVGILRPLQAAHFLVAAAELHLRIHEYGKSKDAEQMGLRDVIRNNRENNLLDI